MSHLSKGILHGIVGAALFAIPLILASHSPLLDLTLGCALNAAYQWFVSWYSTLPQS
jgi:hypothetical protein